MCAKPQSEIVVYFDLESARCLDVTNARALMICFNGVITRVFLHYVSVYLISGSVEDVIYTS